MHHPIAKRCGAHQARFGLTYRELPVDARCVGEAAQLVLELEQFSFQVGGKVEHIGAIALALARLPESGEQGGEAGDAGIVIPQRRLGLGHPTRLRPERPSGSGDAAG